jgi:hypothetical protein
VNEEALAHWGAVEPQANENAYFVFYPHPLLLLVIEIQCPKIS